MGGSKAKNLTGAGNKSHEELAKATDGLKYLRKQISVDIPIQQIIILLEVAENPGITQTELGERLSMSPSSISRSVRMLGNYLERSSDEMKGYGLVETRPDLRERHRQSCFVTERGRTVVDEFAEILIGKRKENKRST